MPVKSKAQFRFMKAIESGHIKKEGLDPEKAKEFTKGISKRKFHRLEERLKVK